MDTDNNGANDCNNRKCNGDAVSELIKTRRSTRQFNEEEVPSDDLLRALLDDAKWAPSWCNTHPYFVCVSKGERKERIRAKLCEKYDGAIEAAKRGVLGKIQLWATGGAPDGDYDCMVKYAPDLQKKRVDCAKGLYGLMGIAREDKLARERQDRRNFEFFDAPVVLFIFVEGNMGPYAALDAGFYMNTLMISAHARGLGTCAQGSLAMWSSPIREEFSSEISDGYKFMCGLSLSYPT